jgi:hypothetical protein
MLTRDEILLLLGLLSEETVVEPNPKFPYRVSRRRVTGYSDIPVVGRLQAKLSIMLEVAAKREGAAASNTLKRPTMKDPP